MSADYSKRVVGGSLKLKGGTSLTKTIDKTKKRKIPKSTADDANEEVIRKEEHITSTTAPISTTGELKISKNLIIDQRTDDLQRIDKQIELKDRRKLIEQEKNAAKEALELMRQKEIEAEKYGFKILNYSGSTNVSNNLNKEYIQRGSLDARHTATLKLNEREKKKSDRYTASLSQDKQATLNIELLRLT